MLRHQSKDLNGRLKMTFSKKIEDYMSSPTSPFAQRNRPTYPTGWEPGVVHDETGSTTVTTRLLPQLEDEDSWKEAVESLGVKVPEG